VADIFVDRSLDGGASNCCAHRSLPDDDEMKRIWQFLRRFYWWIPGPLPINFIELREGLDEVCASAKEGGDMARALTQQIRRRKND